MVTNKNCQAQASDSPAQAVENQIHPKVREFLKDWYMEDPEFTQLTRRNLRVWFVNNIEDWDGNFGTTLDIQVLHYEALDELLSIIIANQEAK